MSEDVLRIFIHAPKTYRVEKIREMYGDSKEDALRNIRHSDNARSAYYRNVSGQNWGDPHNYELCLDASMGEDVCVDMIWNAVNSLRSQENGNSRL